MLHEWSCLLEWKKDDEIRMDKCIDGCGCLKWQWCWQLEEDLGLCEESREQRLQRRGHQVKTVLNKPHVIRHYLETGGEERGSIFNEISAFCEMSKLSDSQYEFFFFKLQKSILVTFWSENWVWQTTLLFWNINQVDICVSTSIRTKSFVLLPLNVKYLVFKSLLLHLTFSLSLSCVCVFMYVFYLYWICVHFCVGLSCCGCSRLCVYIYIYMKQILINNNKCKICIVRAQSPKEHALSAYEHEQHTKDRRINK